MSEHRYLHSTTKDEIEFNRLRLLERIDDPTTICHLEMIGISEGSNCLEVGAGAGSNCAVVLKACGILGEGGGH